MAAEVSRWYDAVERRERSQDAPGWLQALEEAFSAEIGFRPAEATASLAAAQPPADAPEWSRVKRLLELQTRLRGADASGMHALVADVDALLSRLSGEEAATAARAWHLLGTLQIRLNRYEEAERCLARALTLLRPEEETRRAWVLDGFGQALSWLGAWEEARRVFAGVADRKRASGDALGAAITLGNRAMLDLQVGEPAAAELSARLALTSADGLPLFTRLRLQTLVVQARLDAGGDAGEESTVLLQRVEEAGRHPHHLVSFAALALARCASDPAEVERWLRHAEPGFGMPEQRVLLEYWRERLRPSGESPEVAWAARMEILFAESGAVTDGEILARLLMIERALDGGRLEDAKRHLRAALDRARESNNRTWIQMVDRMHGRVDPAGQSDEMIERFSGRNPAELARTTEEDATIVFVDLVDFTPRAGKLPPAEVMGTVRSFFEIAVPLLVEERVRPLSCLGDGLLAIAEGPGHPSRGFAFARRLVARAGRASIARAALGERWGLAVRAGVASGTVVKGLLGNLMKLEYAAIGLTTNLASRLQSKANPGEVVCSARTAAAAGIAGLEETLELKGFDAPVAAVRLRIDPLEVSAVASAWEAARSQTT